MNLPICATRKFKLAGNSIFIIHCSAFDCSCDHQIKGTVWRQIRIVDIESIAHKSHIFVGLQFVLHPFVLKIVTMVAKLHSAAQALIIFSAVSYVVAVFVQHLLNSNFIPQ